MPGFALGPREGPAYGFHGAHIVIKASGSQTRWTMRWKPALNAFAITFSDRFPAAETY